MFVGTVDDASDGDLIELVILCECGRFDDDDFVVVLLVLSRLASVSDFVFCFIASVGSTYHLWNNLIYGNWKRMKFSNRFLSYFWERNSLKRSVSFGSGENPAFASYKPR